MLHTTSTVGRDKQQEVVAIDVTSTPGRTPKRMKQNELSQEDVMREYA